MISHIALSTVNQRKSALIASKRGEALKWAGLCGNPPINHFPPVISVKKYNYTLFIILSVTVNDRMVPHNLPFSPLSPFFLSPFLPFRHWNPHREWTGSVSRFPQPVGAKSCDRILWPLGLETIGWGRAATPREEEYKLGGGGHMSMFLLMFMGERANSIREYRCF